MANSRKRALVVGASGGIGEAISEELNACGHEVITLSRRLNGLDITDEESIKRVIGNLDGQFELIVVALSDARVVPAIITLIIRTTGAETKRQKGGTAVSCRSQSGSQSVLFRTSFAEGAALSSTACQRV